MGERASHKPLEGTKRRSYGRAWEGPGPTKLFEFARYLLSACTRGITWRADGDDRTESACVCYAMSTSGERQLTLFQCYNSDTHASHDKNRRINLM